MSRRYLFNSILDLALKRNKMAFISGPRQVGKTTLSRSYRDEFDVFSYHNWDESTFRRMWVKDPNQLVHTLKLEELNSNRLVILDEIHKSNKWKQKIKGLYDLYQNELVIIVTGSARLNVFKKGGDSLMGRYLNFRLHPLSYGELISTKQLAPDEWLKKVFSSKPQQSDQLIIDRLMLNSGFPEPYFANSKNITNIWRQSRHEKIIREDLRDLSRLPELSKVEMLASLLPEKIGSPLSVQSLREDLEVAHDTVRRWLNYLEELYYFFEIKPWGKSIPRTIKKEGKIYLYDWTEITDESIKFENLVACQLIKACHYWTDTGEGLFDLHYIRNKEKQEIDFLISKNKKPWLTIECKYSETQIDHKLVDKFMNYTKCPHIQVVHKKNIKQLISNKMVISASLLFEGLP